MAEEISGGGGDFYKMGQAMGPEKIQRGVGDDLTTISKSINTLGTAMAAERKAEERELKDARNLAGKKISQMFVDMGPQLKELGQESYTQAQNEVEALRYKMYEAIDAKDQKAQADIMIQLNEIKARHAGDAEGLKAFVETWEPDEDGERAVSTDAMTKEDIAVVEQFLANDSKRTVYSDEEPPKLYYEWDVPVVGPNGVEAVDENGQPLMETKRYSVEDLQEKLIIKDTVNGTKMLDYGQKLKEDFKANPDTPPDAAMIKSEVAKIIPKDPKAIRDWLHGNPADRPGLDVHDYLVDLMGKDFNTFGKLGIDMSQLGSDPNGVEINFGGETYMIGDGDGDVDADDFPRELQDALIKNVMDVKDLQISHDIITEIYAKHLQYDMLGENNKDYRRNSDISILGSEVDTNKFDKAKRDEALVKLQSLKDPNSPIYKEISAMSPEKAAKHLGFKSINSKIFNPTPPPGRWESISNYIPTATGVIGSEEFDVNAHGKN